jgi:CO/xanthine dehydrogenase FAD-binding subunit
LAGRYGTDARVLAGGTVLLAEMARGEALPGAVIDLSRAGLAGISERAIGAMTTYSELEMSGLHPVLARCAFGITGGAQIRNRGTVGGSAAWSNPSSDMPAVLVGLSATLVLASVSGERRVPAQRFFTDAFRTDRKPDEVLISIELPEMADEMRFGYQKLKFGESSWPIVTALALIRSDGSIRVSLGGAAAIPIAIESATARGLEEKVTAALTDPWSDVLATADYRRRVSPVIARRALEAA